jgi:hypothetical protein
MAKDPLLARHADQSVRRVLYGGVVTRCHCSNAASRHASHGCSACADHHYAVRAPANALR